MIAKHTRPVPAALLPLALLLLLAACGSTSGAEAASSADTITPRPVTPQSSGGSLAFQVPAAATSGLHLLYRPEVAAETAIIPLQGA